VLLVATTDTQLADRFLLAIIRCGETPINTRCDLRGRGRAVKLGSQVNERCGYVNVIYVHILVVV